MPLRRVIQLTKLDSLTLFSKQVSTMVIYSPPPAKVIFPYIAKVCVELGKWAFAAFLAAIDVGI
jgi:hypothetical protein